MILNKRRKYLFTKSRNCWIYISHIRSTAESIFKIVMNLPTPLKVAHCASNTHIPHSSCSARTIGCQKYCHTSVGDFVLSLERRKWGSLAASTFLVLVPSEGLLLLRCCYPADREGPEKWHPWVQDEYDATAANQSSISHICTYVHTSHIPIVYICMYICSSVGHLHCFFYTNERTRRVYSQMTSA